MSTNTNTQFLNFSDALHHLRWGERIARRSWPRGQFAVADYRGADTTINVAVTSLGVTEHFLSGAALLAEDWYVLCEHQ